MRGEGGCMAKGEACMANGSMCGVAGSIAKGVCMAKVGCVAGGAHGKGGMCGRGCAWQESRMAGKTATAADGTHPTGMHSCLQKFSSCRVRLSS